MTAALLVEAAVQETSSAVVASIEALCTWTININLRGSGTRFGAKGSGDALGLGRPHERRADFTTFSDASNAASRTMTSPILDKLLTTLDVRLHAFAVCEVGEGWRLVFDAMDAVVVHYVLAGTGVLRVGNNFAVPFAPHSILFVPPRQKQSLGHPGHDSRELAGPDNCAMLADGLVKFTAAESPGAGHILTVCGSITATYGGGLGLFDQLRQPLAENVSEVEPLRTAFQQMLAELALPRVGTRALTEALMKQCLILVLRNHLTQHGVNSPLFAALQDPRLARAVTAMIERPAEPFTVEALSALAGMSRSSFSERFSEVFGQSPIDFLQRIRLRQAAHLLRTTDVPVKVISASIGYASRSYFSRAFRAAYGVDPKTFRSFRQTAQEEALSTELTESRGLWE